MPYSGSDDEIREIILPFAAVRLQAQAHSCCEPPFIIVSKVLSQDGP